MRFLNINLRLLGNTNPFLHVFQVRFTKVISAITGAPSMSKEEVDTSLENKLNLQIGTIDEDGDPNIHPTCMVRLR
jgi:hypothetical protein